MPDAENASWKVRPLVPDADMHAWLELIHAVEMDESGKIDTTEEHLRRGLNYPRMTRWVVEANGGLAGYALLFAQIPERSQMAILVHPQWRRRGIGGTLLAHLLDEARKINAQWANFEINEQSAACRAFLEKHGFSPFSHAWILRAPAGTQFPAPEWPAGFSSRSYAEVNDLEIFAQACNRSYGDRWGHHENTTGGLTTERFKEVFKYYQPEGIFIAFGPDGSPAGVTRGLSGAVTGEEEDQLDNPAVVPEHRHLKLQLPLALTLLQWLRGQGDRPVRLESWGDAQEVIALYQGIGFEVVEHDLAYRKAL